MNLQSTVRCTPSLMLLHYLAANMRQDEALQYTALTGKACDVDRVAVEFWESFNRNCGAGWALADKETGEPLIAGGYELVVPGVWQSWMVGTPRAWEHHWRDIHRATRSFIDQMLDSGARRLQTNALASRIEACAWYEKLGMTKEGEMAHFGINGESVAMYAISRQPTGEDDDGRRE